MIGRFCDGQIPNPGPLTAMDEALIKSAEQLPAAIYEHVTTFSLHEGLEKFMAFSSEVNNYLQQTGPWREAKEGNQERVNTSLYCATEALRLVSVLLSPVMPERTAELHRQLGWQPSDPLSVGLTWGCLQPGAQTQPATPLFPKVE
jgi:methionyl-tRNA synthetase